jgi:hypothetical protein
MIRNSLSEANKQRRIEQEFLGYQQDGQSKGCRVSFDCLNRTKVMINPKPPADLNGVGERRGGKPPLFQLECSS